MTAHTDTLLLFPQSGGRCERCGKMKDELLLATLVSGGESDSMMLCEDCAARLRVRVDAHNAKQKQAAQAERTQSEKTHPTKKQKKKKNAITKKNAWKIVAIASFVAAAALAAIVGIQMLRGGPGADSAPAEAPVNESFGFVKLEKKSGETGLISADGLIGVKADGTVAMYFTKDDLLPEYAGIQKWTDIVGVTYYGTTYYGLRRDGTVVAAGENYSGQCNVSGWTNVVRVSAGESFVVGLRSNGTVVAAGDNYDGQCDVSAWRRIISVSAGGNYTVGLRVDGKVLMTGTGPFWAQEYPGVSDWTDIVAISASDKTIVGLKSDGTVVATGSNAENQCAVSDWTDIVAISANRYHTVGLRSDGTVVSTQIAEADNYANFGQCDVADWTDIIAVSAGYNWTLGLKADGTVVTTLTGDEDMDELLTRVSGWTDMMV